MPRLKGVTSKKIIKILKKKGFQLDHATGSHFIFYHKDSGKRVVVPFHCRDLPRGTLFSIIKNADIDLKEL